MSNKLTIPGIVEGDKDSLIVCRNSQGMEVRATPLRLSRYLVVFEVYNPYSILQLSEVLEDFKIVINERLVYSGRGVVSNLVNTGIILICEATLGDHWLDVDIFSPISQRDKLQSQFVDFVNEWKKIYRVMPDYKVIVADLQTLFVDLRRWFEQVELAVRSQPSGNRGELEREIIQELTEPIAPTVTPIFERFESVSSQVEEDAQPVHRNYIQRQLHPLILCSPFFFRSYQKPLGYAGDYEMVNMMLRDPLEGSSMFAKMLNCIFLNTPPVLAHRNRITYLVERLVDEVQRAAGEGRVAKIFNLGCGPAQEIQKFLVHYDLSNYAEFVLLDFNDETLAFTQKTLEELKQRHHRTTKITLLKKSVHQILQESAKSTDPLYTTKYDMVYCAGLFDYLSDRICKRLMNVFYSFVADGGLLVATNVDADNPARNWMEFAVEWHLVYRNRKQMEALFPERSDSSQCKVLAENTGVNDFIEVRKPKHG